MFQKRFFAVKFNYLQKTNSKTARFKYFETIFTLYNIYLKTFKQVKVNYKNYKIFYLVYTIFILQRIYLGVLKIFVATVGPWTATNWSTFYQEILLPYFLIQIVPVAVPSKVDYLQKICFKTPSIYPLNKFILFG